LEFRRLIPDPAVVTSTELLAGLHFDDRAGDQRPYTAVNFVATADGRAAFQGRSVPLGDDADREIFLGLREHVDAVFAGTRTLRIERYGRMVSSAERRERRAQAGRRPEPLACVVTLSGEVPVEIPLFREPNAQIVIFSPRDPDLSGCAAQVEVVRLDRGELTLTTVLRRLRADFGVRSLLCEGGPTVFGALLQERVVDELFLTLAPKLAGGGSSPTITSGPELPELLGLEIVWALERAHSLFLRYAVR
jgi:5-amino-6-(5-phosphoribosylamino)uracil reductase